MASWTRSEEHTSELQSRRDLVCRLLLEKKKHISYYRLCRKKKKCQAHRCTTTPHTARACRLCGQLFQEFYCCFWARFTLFFFFNHPAPTEIYTLSLHDALPIPSPPAGRLSPNGSATWWWPMPGSSSVSTRSEEHTSDSSHVESSYAVFCLKKKKEPSTRSAARPDHANPRQERESG